VGGGIEVRQGTPGFAGGQGVEELRELVPGNAGVHQAFELFPRPIAQFVAHFSSSRVGSERR